MFELLMAIWRCRKIRSNYVFEREITIVDCCVCRVKIQFFFLINQKNSLISSNQQQKVRIFSTKTVFLIYGFTNRRIFLGRRQYLSCTMIRLYSSSMKNVDGEQDEKFTRTVFSRSFNWRNQKKKGKNLRGLRIVLFCFLLV